jgi:hypothetical protein
MKNNVSEKVTEKVQITNNDMSLMRKGSSCCLVCQRALTLVETSKEGSFITKPEYDLLGLREHFKYQRKVTRRIEANTVNTNKVTAAAAVTQ